MAISTTAGKYPVRSQHRELVLYTFSFKGKNGANPATADTVDPEGLINTIVRDGEGSYVVTFKIGWRKAYPAGKPNVRSTTEGDHANVDTITEGTSVATVLALTAFGGGAADDLDGVRIDVFMALQR